MGTAANSSPGKSRSSLLAHVVAGLALWLPLLNHLRLEWAINEQYQYGFFVPLLAAYLAWLRWADRPEAQPLRSRGVLVFPASAALLAIALLMLVEGANQDWRLLSWLWTGLVVFVTGLGILAVGGLPWLRHFLVPLGFIFVAVPWPMALEMRIISELTAWNAAAAAELLNWLGVHAEHLGSVVRVAKADIGIDDACSGVRSVQASIMVACLFGETYRLPLLLRALLVGASLATGLACNLARTLSLVWLADARGETAMNAWHDQIGMVALGISWAMWFLLARYASSVIQSRKGEQWLLPGGARGLTRREREERPQVLPRPLSALCCLGIAAFLALTALSVEGWYRSRAPQNGGSFAWTIRAPILRAVVESPIPVRAREILKYSRGTSWRWEDGAGRRWSAFHLQWDPGRTAANLAGTHRPDVCLPAGGRTFVQDCGVTSFPVNGTTLPFRHYIFQEGRVPLHVFFHLSTPGAETHAAMTSSVRLTRAERLRCVRERRRNEGQQQLEVALWGVADANAARRELAAALGEMLVVKADPAGARQLSDRSAVQAQPGG